MDEREVPIKKQLALIGGCLLPCLLIVGLILGVRQCVSNELNRAGKGIGEALNAGMDALDHSLSQSQHPQPSLPGELILKNYGSSSGRPEEDLTMLSNVFSNLTLLIKGDDPFRMGANDEFAAALRGKNRTHQRLLPDIHKTFNFQGQLVDRWQTPLFFHALSHDRIDIRSAGPDRKMWTEDDIHRRYDGQFLKGKELNARGAFEEKRPGAADR